MTDDAKPQAVPKCDHGLERWGKGCHITHWDHIERCPKAEPVQPIQADLEPLFERAREVRSRAFSRSDQYKSGNEYTYDGQIMLDAGDVINDLIEALALRTASCALPSRERIGRTIYLAMYEAQGGKWEANETREVWYKFADAVLALLTPVRSGEHSMKEVK